MSTLMKNVIFILFAQLLSVICLAKNVQSPELVINRVIQLYNQQNFKDSLSLLDTIKDTRDSYVNWYYFYALNQIRLNNNDEALSSFETFVKKFESPGVSVSRSYYYIGLLQFQRNDFEKALNSLEISLDVSNDPQLDVMTEALIDKTIRYQNYFESSKRSNITFLLGYNYDANAINLSPDSFEDNLNGNVFGYGFSASHKIVDRYKFVFEPTLAILDSYTFDSKFKGNSTLQSTDALQLLVSLPIRFFFNEEKYTNRYDVSLNAYSVYLPVTTTARDLSLSSVFLKTQIAVPYSSSFAIRYSATLATDTAYGFTTDEDNASGIRGELAANFTHFLSEETINNIFYDVGADYTAAKGINGRFKKLSTSVGYMYPSFWESVSSVRAGLVYLTYPDKLEPRTDTQVNLGYNITKSFQSGSTLAFSITALTNNSNIRLNKYNDFVSGLQYTKSIGF